jgi:hypothetical protein
MLPSRTRGVLWVSALAHSSASKDRRSSGLIEMRMLRWDPHTDTDDLATWVLHNFIEDTLHYTNEIECKVIN